MTSNSVTEAIYDAGFNSSGRFYAKSTDMLGMTPTHYRPGGANERNPLRRSASARWARSWSRRATRASARSCSATIPTRWCATCRTASRRPT